MGKLIEMLREKDIIARVGKVVYIKENVSFLHDTQLMDDAAPLIIKKKKANLELDDEDTDIEDEMFSLNDEDFQEEFEDY